MHRLTLLALALDLLSACNQPCTSDSQCTTTGEICALGEKLNVCRKACSLPIDCGAGTQCAQAANGRYACLKLTELPPPAMMSTVDTSLGEVCGTADSASCGDGAPLCNAVFKNDPALGDISTCTVECSADADCAARAPMQCTGECQAQYDNMSCFASGPLGSPELYFGTKRDAQGALLTFYCRPRLFGYLVPKRCTTDSQCGSPGTRAGDKCTTTMDGGGACLSGKLGLYECCHREGECDQSASNNLNCTPSVDNLSGYCSKACTQDAECQSAGAPAGASCWTTTYIFTDIAGKCKVQATTDGLCRPGPKPVVPTPASAYVDCPAASDRPVDKTDNKYDTTVRRCTRTF